MSGPAVDIDRGVVIHASARDGLRQLRPALRVVFEDVALDAAWRDGQLVASTSARLVAEHLGIDAGTAASALRVLRDRGFVKLEQHTGPDGRFGLAEYVVHLPVGIELTGSPCTDRPRTANPGVATPDTASTPRLTERRRRATSSSKRVEQGMLDLGSGARSEPPSSPARRAGKCLWQLRSVNAGVGRVEGDGVD
jgi:hypothetical protein